MTIDYTKDSPKKFGKKQISKLMANVAYPKRRNLNYLISTAAPLASRIKSLYKIEQNSSIQSIPVPLENPLAHLEKSQDAVIKRLKSRHWYVPTPSQMLCGSERD